VIVTSSQASKAVSLHRAPASSQAQCAVPPQAAGDSQMRALVVALVYPLHASPAARVGGQPLQQCHICPFTVQRLPERSARGSCPADPDARPPQFRQDTGTAHCLRHRVLGASSQGASSTYYRGFPEPNGLARPSQESLSESRVPSRRQRRSPDSGCFAARRWFITTRRSNKPPANSIRRRGQARPPRRRPAWQCGMAVPE